MIKHQNNSLSKLNTSISAFTLVELLVTVAIIGILATIAIGAFRTYKQRSYDAVAMSDIKNLITAQESYVIVHEEYYTPCTSGGTPDLTPLTGFTLSAEIEVPVICQSTSGEGSAHYVGYWICMGHIRGATDIYYYSGDGKIFKLPRPDDPVCSSAP